MDRNNRYCHTIRAPFYKSKRRSRPGSLSVFIQTVLLLFATVSPGTSGAMQQSQGVQRNNDGGYTLQTRAEEVVLNCTVVDDKGRLVNDLGKQDFKVFEDKARQTIVSLQHQDIPVSIGILVDNSGSMRDKRAAVNAAALDLIRASNPEDEAFVVNFSDQAFVDQDFTSDLGKLRGGLSHIGSSGGTALYDAIVASSDRMAKFAKRPKQVLIIVTDGEDNASTLSLEQAIHRVQDMRGPVVYSIGLLFGGSNTFGESHRAKHALQTLSNETGGIAFFPSSLNDVDAVAAEVARDIRNQYTIAYHSKKAFSLGGYRTVKVEAHASSGGKLTVHTRPGYLPFQSPASNVATKPE
jgi:Ca-activated chloride channel family protein